MDATARTQTYMALQALSARWSAHGGSGSAADTLPFRDLTPFELRVFSQNGEDGVIEEILRRVGVSTARFIEFGAEAGLEGNCVFLAEVLGWEGLFMEADADQYSLLALRYRDRPRVVTRHTVVTPANVDQLIIEAGLEGDIDVLSIDIDSHDYWVWAAIAAARPRVVIVEYNAHIPYPVARTQPLWESGPWQGTDYFGASLGAFEYLAGRRGYTLVHTDLAGVNAFFVLDELAAALPSGDAVPRRAPNFFLTGTGHPRDGSGRQMVDPAVG